MSRNEINFEAIFDFSPIKRNVRNHLVNVYLTLGMSLLCAAVGAYYSNLNTGRVILAFVCCVALMIGILATNKKYNIYRLIALSIFSFLVGSLTSPLVRESLEIDPSIVVISFGSTMIIFTSLSLFAIFSKNRSLLFLGGYVTSGLSLLLFFGFINIFLQSGDLFMYVEVYFGLLVFCGLVLFDTQLMVARVMDGDDDYIWHSLGLFLDFINIFVRILKIVKKIKEKDD